MLEDGAQDESRVASTTVASGITRSYMDRAISPRKRRQKQQLIVRQTTKIETYTHLLSTNNRLVIIHLIDHRNHNQRASNEYNPEYLPSQQC